MDPIKNPKVVNIMKKVILGILIAFAVMVIIFIVLTALKSFQTPKTNLPSTYNQTTGFGLAEDSSSYGLSAPAMPSIPREYYAGNTDSIAVAGSASEIQAKIIKTGNLSIAVNDVEKTVGQITNEAILVNGFVQNSSVTENEKGQKYANLILRVPAISFESVINKIKLLANLVEREDINGREVTEEYVDLQADLIHNQAVEAQYLELLKRAQKVEEIIAVRNKLDQVQGEIERLKGRLRYLDNQTEMSTIAVTISSEANVTLPAEKWQPWVVVKETVKKLVVSIQNFVNFVIISIFFLVSLIPYLLLIYILYRLVKWLIKKFRKTKQTV